METKAIQKLIIEFTVDCPVLVETIASQARPGLLTAVHHYCPWPSVSGNSRLSVARPGLLTAVNHYCPWPSALVETIARQLSGQARSTHRCPPLLLHFCSCRSNHLTAAYVVATLVALSPASALSRGGVMGGGRCKSRGATQSDEKSGNYIDYC
ncbi:hypothetical protein J6590_095298 [Homalodisca vitripennis]|nr:hypothetical protein J6590_095298 [Homalodisca vitripennis]